MSRLEELLRDASEPDDLWSLDPSAIAREGRRRVVRRRWTRAGVAAAALVLVGGAVAVPLLHGSGPDDRVADAAGQGEYRDVVLSRAEMERRCTTELNARNGTDVQYVAGRAPDGTAVPSTGLPGYVETREGWAVQLIPEGKTWHKGMPLDTAAPSGAHLSRAARRAHLGATRDVCMIPQPGVASDPASVVVPLPGDHEAILDACSQASGYDFSGWQVLAAVNTAETATTVPVRSIDAVLFSTNGHEAQCWLRPDGGSGVGMIPRPFLTSDGQPLLLREDNDPAHRYSVVLPTNDDSMGLGIVPGLPDGWRIDVLQGGNYRVATVTTNRGGFVYKLGGAVGARVWGARVRDNEGTIVWEGQLARSR